MIATPTCPDRLGEAFALPGEWRVQIAHGTPEGIYDLSVQREAVIRGFHRGARQSWLYDPAYRSHDPAGFPVLTDAQNGGHPLVIRRDTVNTYATGDWPLRAGGGLSARRRTATPTALLDDDQPGDCLAPVDRAMNSPAMIVRGRDSGSFALSTGTSRAAPQLARWPARNLSGGHALDSRAAIRRLAEGQSSRLLPASVVNFPAHFQEFYAPACTINAFRAIFWPSIHARFTPLVHSESIAADDRSHGVTPRLAAEGKNGHAG